MKCDRDSIFVRCLQ